MKICEALAKLVQGFGCTPRQATSGLEALTQVAEVRPDIILLDLQMPAMNGVKFLQKLRETEPLLPVVIVTGYPESLLFKQAMDYAPIMMLSKPVDRALLERTVRGVLGDRVAPAATVPGGASSATVQ